MTLRRPRPVKFCEMSLLIMSLHKMLLFFLITLNFVWTCEGKTIDNKLAETPTVTCGPEKIVIKGKTEDLFEGAIFIKNWRRAEGCAAGYTLDDNSTNPQYSISLDRLGQCGLELRRNPITKELEIFTVFVFSFHPNFVTAGDRSFAVHCIFVQQQVTVATKFNFISDISTRGIISGIAAMPKIEMSIQLDSGPRKTDFVTVGEKLLYIWQVRGNSETYGLRVHECFAEMRDGRRMKVMDDGCSVDNDLITHPKYAENNLKAFANGLAFKFPDSEEITITCVVQICIQKFEHLIVANDKLLCDSLPKCDKRQKRSIKNDKAMAEVYSVDKFVHHRLRVLDATSSPLTLQIEEADMAQNMTICLEKMPFAGITAAIAATYLITLCLITALSFNVHRSHQQKL